MLHRIYFDMTLFEKKILDKEGRMEKIMESITQKQTHQEEGREEKMPWLIHPNCLFKSIWNVVLILLLVYTATVMPY